MQQHSCTVCGKAFETSRSHARYCSSTCRGKALKSRKAEGAEVVTLRTSPVVDADGLVGAVTVQLQAAEKLSTYGGQQALVVAMRLQSSGGDTGAAVAALSKELERLMSVLMADVRSEPDAIDQAQAAVVQLRTTRRRRG